MIKYFERFSIEMTAAQAESASHQGQCDADVEYLVKQPKIRRQLAKIPDQSLIDELREYGAWSEEQLQDRAENEQRIIWIAAGDIIDRMWEKKQGR